jgi:hypothetical protein
MSKQELFEKIIKVENDIFDLRMKDTLDNEDIMRLSEMYNECANLKNTYRKQYGAITW